MRKLLFIFAISSFILSGNIYLSADIQNAFFYHSDFIDINHENDYDSGFVSLGYNHNVYQEEQFLLDVGFSFTVAAANYPGLTFFSPFSDDNFTLQDLGLYKSKTKFYSVYILPHFTVSDMVDLWVKLGHTSGRNTHFKGLTSGLLYGLGLQIFITKRIDLGLGYCVYNSEFDMSKYLDGQYNWVDSNSSIIHLKSKRLSLDLYFKI